MLDFSVLNEAMDNGPVRNPTYARSATRKGVLYAISQGKYSYEAIAGCLETYPARRLCVEATETPAASTVCRFWKRAWKYLPLVFEYVTDVLEEYDIYGDTFAIDATALPTSEDDPDAVWAFDEHSEDNFYYGCGLVAVVDCASDLPAGAVFCQREQHSEDQSIDCLKQVTETTEVETLSAMPGMIRWGSTSSVLIGRFSRSARSIRAIWMKTHTDGRKFVEFSPASIDSDYRRVRAAHGSFLPVRQSRPPFGAASHRSSPDCHPVPRGPLL